MTTPYTPDPWQIRRPRPRSPAKRAGPSQHPGLSRRAPRCRAAPANPGPIRTGSDEAQGVPCCWRALDPRYNHSPPWRDDQYDGIEYAGLPVNCAGFAIALRSTRFDIRPIGVAYLASTVFQGRTTVSVALLSCRSASDDVPDESARRGQGCRWSGGCSRSASSAGRSCWLCTLHSVGSHVHHVVVCEHRTQGGGSERRVDEAHYADHAA